VNYQVRLRPELLADASAAYQWYEAQATGLGDEFLRSFYASVAVAGRNPVIFKKTYTDFRRILLRRFPYALYYRIENEAVVFFLLFHCARHPGVPRQELRRRKNIG